MLKDVDWISYLLLRRFAAAIWTSTGEGLEAPQARRRRRWKAFGYDPPKVKAARETCDTSSTTSTNSTDSVTSATTTVPSS
jgi:hypothetical protein